MRLVTIATAKSFAFLIVTQASADMWQITTFSSNSRLMAYVVFMENLENGMVVQEWQRNDAAKALDPRYGSEGGFPTRGLIAQDVTHTRPEAVITDVGTSTMTTLAIRASYLEYACWVAWAWDSALDVAACTTNWDAWQRTDHF